MNAFQSPGRARLVGLGVLVAAFLAGAGLGAAVDRAVSVGDVQTETAGDESDDADDDRGRHGTDILDRLSLSPEQRARVDRIMSRKRSELEAFWDTAGPRLRGITASARTEIRGVLTPAQRAEYDRLLAERHARHDHDDRDEESDR